MDLISASSRLMASNSSLYVLTVRSTARGAPSSCAPSSTRTPSPGIRGVVVVDSKSTVLDGSCVDVKLDGRCSEPRTGPALPNALPAPLTHPRLDDEDAGVVRCASVCSVPLGFGVANAPESRKTRPSPPLAPTSIARYSSASRSRSESSYSMPSSEPGSYPGVERGEGPARPLDDETRAGGGSISSSSMVSA